MKRNSLAYLIFTMSAAIVFTLGAAPEKAMAQQAARQTATSSAVATPTAETVAPGKPETTQDLAPGEGGRIIGDIEPPSASGQFFDDIAPACENCGGGGCLPPDWSIFNEARILGLSRANNHILSTNTLPAGPFELSAATNGVTAQFQYFNNVINTSQLEVHTLNFSVSPGWELNLTHFLGRDGEQRDHFINFDYFGLNRWSRNQSVNGTVVPIYDTTPFPSNNNIATVNQNPPTIKGYTGSLVSPFPTPQVASDDPSFAEAFNGYNPTFNAFTGNASPSSGGAEYQSAAYSSSLNNWEVNYEIASRTQPDQLVMNPNGRWYRECQKGFFYNYIFGLRVISVDETFQYLSAGQSFNTVSSALTPQGMAQGSVAHTYNGSYLVHTWNTLYGIQTGGTLEYRFCRWSVDTHAKVGAYLNPAIQTSNIQGYMDGVHIVDDPFQANNSVVAFAGDCGVHLSYKFTPNFIGHISYDMLFVGDLARAPEQLEFIANPTPNITTQGAAFYNGMSIGCELTW